MVMCFVEKTITKPSSQTNLKIATPPPTPNRKEVKRGILETGPMTVKLVYVVGALHIEKK